MPSLPPTHMAELTDERSMDNDPLDASERVQVHSILASEASETLARRVSRLMETDRTAEAVHRLEVSLTAEFRAIAAEFRSLRNAMFGLIALTMVINAAMVGIGISMGVGQHVTVETAPPSQPTITFPSAAPVPFPMPDIAVPWPDTKDEDTDEDGASGMVETSEPMELDR